MDAADKNEVGDAVDHSGPPARVLHAWHVDPRFTGDDGAPRVLPFEGAAASFTSLVHSVAGDVPPGAVRAELKRAGAVVELENVGIKAIKRYYVPGNVDERAITTISGMFYPLAAGLAHNTNPNRTSDGFIQRFAFSDKLAPEMVPAFRRWARAESTRFIESMDDWLAAHEEEDGGLARSEQALRAGVGVFYYEGPSAEDLLSK